MTSTTSARSAGVAASPAIAARGLSRSFGDITAVRNLTLEIPRGAVVGLLGPNGAGKTTTIRLLLGLIAPTAGEARVLDFDTRRGSREIRRRSGVLFEHTGLYGHLTARENLDFHGRLHRLPRAERQGRIKELMDRFDLLSRADHRAEKFSRGMRQKLGIARALLHRPELLFLDEPTAGLDPEAAVALRGDILRLASQERTTILITTHNLAEAEQVCDHLAVLRSGRLLAAGSKGRVIGTASNLEEAYLTLAERADA